MKTITVICPGCQAEMRVDATTGDVLEHRAAPPRSRTVDLDRAAEQLQRQERARDARFRQAENAERNRDALLEEKFKQRMQRVRENPDEPMPIRDVDLD